MIINKIKNIFIVLVFFVSFEANAESNIEHKIAVIVNEEMITSYDIIQRYKLSSILQGREINSNNSQLLINNTVDELIYEKLKQEKIFEYEIEISPDEYLDFENNFFDRSGFEKNELTNILEINNINVSELENLLKNELSWNKLVNGLFIRLTSVSDIEIDEIISKNPNLKTEQAKNFVIQRQLDLKSSKLLRDMLNEATIEYR